jgi:hypothetical protein
VASSVPSRSTQSTGALALFAFIGLFSARIRKSFVGGYREITAHPKYGPGVPISIKRHL